MTPTEKRQINRAFQRRLARHSNKFASILLSVISKHWNEAAEQVKIGLEPKFDRKDWVAPFYKLYLTIGLEEAIVNHNAILKRKSEEDDLIYQWLNFLRGHVALELGSRITKINDTTLADVKKVIEEGLTEGYGYDKIANNLRKESTNDFNKNRALLISRTEGLNAANRGAYEAAKSSGLLMKKSWLHGYNAKRKNREAHIALGLQKPINLQDKFLVNGKLMDYPGDPAGGAAECCNCKCNAIYTPVRDGNGLAISLLVNPRQETISQRMSRSAVIDEVIKGVIAAIEAGLITFGLS